jgi:hypothetical protein
MRLKECYEWLISYDSKGDSHGLFEHTIPVIRLKRMRITMKI